MLPHEDNSSNNSKEPTPVEPLAFPPVDLPLYAQNDVMVRRGDVVNREFGWCPFDPSSTTAYGNFHTLRKAKSGTYVYKAEVLRRSEHEPGVFVPDVEVVIKRTKPWEAKPDTDDPVLEIEALQHVRGLPGVLTLLDCFRGPDGSVFLVVPYLQGGDLHDLVRSTNGGQGLREEEARVVFEEIVRTVLALREKHGVIHNDLSLENVLMPGGRPVLIDLGMAQLIPSEPGTLQIPGRPRRGKVPYMPHEVFYQRPRDPFAGDVFSLGICLHVMLTGKMLYRHSYDPGFSMVMKGRAAERLKAASWQLSYEARELITSMLDPDFGRRITLEEVLNHPWVTGQSPSTQVQSP
jgi:serine/threonine protein kinase